MTTYTVELPDQLAAELQNRQVSNDGVERFIVRSLELWLRVGYRADEQQPSTIEEHANGVNQSSASPFSKDPTPFVDQLLDDNLELFEELAKH